MGTGFDSQYQAPFFHSRYDNGISVSEATDNATADALAEVATLIARSAYVRAGGVPADALSLIGNVDADHARELWRCISNKFACPLVAEIYGVEVSAVSNAMGARADKRGPLSLYSDIYRPLKVEENSIRLMERFVRNYLTLYGRSES